MPRPGNGLPHDPATDTLIEADLTRLLFEQLPASLVITAANALLVAAAMSRSPRRPGPGSGSPRCS